MSQEQPSAPPTIVAPPRLSLAGRLLTMLLVAGRAPGALAQRLWRSGASRYLRFILFCIIFDAFVRWIDFKFDEVGDKPHLYPVMIVHITLPFLAVWSLWKMLALPASHQSQVQHPSSSTDPLGSTTAPLEQLLRGLESSMQQALRDGERGAARLESYGRWFAMLSTLVPLVTWVYALVVAHDKNKLDNLWALTFSSTGAGSLGVTIGVTLLRHAKAARARLESLSEEILVIRKMRVVCLADYDSEAKASLVTALGARLAAAGRPSANGAADAGDEHGAAVLEAIMRVLPAAKGG